MIPVIGGPVFLTLVDIWLTAAPRFLQTNGLAD
ncbi:DUF6529 family protein [Mycolicibacterium fluoranthenivorans]